MLDENESPLLEVSALSVAYETEGNKAVCEASFHLNDGEAMGLVGESGTGKSTIALAIMGLLPRDARCLGGICFKGIDILKNPKAIAGMRWRRISLVLQDCMNAFNPVITIGEQLAELWVTHEQVGWAAALRRVAGWLERFGLSGKLSGSYPHELSGGMRQRVAIAMAMALSPALVIVDELTSALDLVTTGVVVELLNEVRRETGAGLLIISHDISVIARTCSRLAVMRNSRIVEAGPVFDILRRPKQDDTRKLVEAVPRLPIFGRASR